MKFLQNILGDYHGFPSILELAEIGFIEDSGMYIYILTNILYYATLSIFFLLVA